MQILPNQLGAISVPCRAEIFSSVLARPSANILEVTRNTRHSQTVTLASVNQFSRWPCRSLNWTTSLTGLGGIYHDPSGIFRRLSFRHRAMTADVALSHRMESNGGRFRLCLSPHPSPTPLSNGNTAGAVFSPSAVSHCCFSRSRSPTGCRRNGLG
jgi:hypothetical protein